MIYISPSKSFDTSSKNFRQYAGALAKIQIDNIFDLGGKKEDILLITNFDYQYNGVKSLVVDDNNYCSFSPISTKTPTVVYLIAKGILKKEELYFVHDFDAYQLNAIKESELELGTADVGFTDYGWSEKWCLGSYFLKSSALDIFQWIKDAMYKYQVNEERVLLMLTRSNTNNINERYKRLNITYNLGKKQVGYNYKIATKPLKVLHFHPYYKDRKLPETNLECFMYGKNELNMPLMTERLIKIFHHHDIK